MASGAISTKAGLRWVAAGLRIYLRNGKAYSLTMAAEASADQNVM